MHTLADANAKHKCTAVHAAPERLLSGEKCVCLCLVYTLWLRPGHVCSSSVMPALVCDVLMLTCELPICIATLHVRMPICQNAER